MKRILNTLIITAAVFAAFSCQKKDDDLLMNESITLDLSSGLTKADHTSTEAFVNHIDVFIFESVSDAPTTGKHSGILVNSLRSSMVRTISKRQVSTWSAV